MDKDSKLPDRLSGGVIGAVLLAVVGGTAGTIAYSTFGDSASTSGANPDEPLTSEPDSTVDMAENTGRAEPQPDPTTDRIVVDPDRIPARTDSTTDTEPAKPDPVPETPAAPPAPVNKNILKQAAFVVRFNKGDEIDRCLELYKKDKDASRKAFTEWAAAHPELDGLALDRVSYSGEALLTYDGTQDANPVSNAKQIQARLNSLEVVRYADPDYTARPGKGD